MPERDGRTEVRITGLGGQGVILAAHIIGHACSINAGLNASMMQSFGPEARGSACTATLVIDRAEVLYPYVLRPSILVAMSAEGYELYARRLADDGLLLFDDDLVRAQVSQGQTARGVPSTRIAESLGRAIVQNIVMVGFFTGVTELVPSEAMREAVLGSVPPGTEELNLEAFELGLRYATDPSSVVLEEVGAPAG